jgi:hypothetical protein
MAGLFDDVLGGTPQPPLNVNPKAYKLLKLAANNPSAEEASAALKKAIEILEEPDLFPRRQIARQHIGGEDSRWTSINEEVPQGFDLVIQVTSTGQFEVWTDDDERISMGKTMEEAVENAKKALTKARTKIKVPFVTEKGERAVATGISLQDGKIMARDSEGKKFKIDKWTGNTLRGDMPDTDLARYRGAKEALEVAEEILHELRQRYQHNLRADVDKAYKEVLGG